MIIEMLCPKCDVRTKIMSMLFDPERHQIRYRCSECEYEAVEEKDNIMNGTDGI